MAVRRVFALLAALALAAPAHAIIDDALDVIKLGKEIGEEILSSWDIIGRPFNASGGVELPLIRRRERLVLARLAQVTRAIQQLELSLEGQSAIALLIARAGGRGAGLELRLHEMADLLARVAAADRQMREYVRLQRALERTTLEDFAAWCVSHDPGALPGLLERVHSLVVPPHKHLLGRSILTLVVDDLKSTASLTAPARRPPPPPPGRPLQPVQYAFNRCGKRQFPIMRFATLVALLAVASARDLTLVDHLRNSFYTLESTLWKNVTDPLWRESGLGGDVELTKAFVSFDNAVEGHPRPPRPPLKTWLWIKATEKLQTIDSLYKHFVSFVRRQAAPGAVPAPVREWLDLAESVLMDPKSSVAQAVRKINDLMEHGDMFRSVLQEEHPDLCDLQLSPHQLIYDMYNTITLTEIKGYAMMQFSWMLLRIYGKGNFTQEASLTRQRYADRSAKTATAARAALSMARRDIYRCDPPVHKEGETYEQVTRLLQGYIENEVDMNPDGTCRENCAHYTLAKNNGCFKEKFCANQQVCKGRIINCQYIDSDMWVCPAKDSSKRRYEWIEYENGRTLGRVGSCYRGTTKVDSWWRWLFWHCSYCMCLCDEEGATSDRYFSLWETTSDVLNNKVVTGIRLVKLGRVFHLQISEGTLGERGAIVPGNWVPIQKFDPSDPGVTNGVDYHTLTYERRAIDLDELDSPAGYVLTGVRFSMIGSHLHFEIRSTPFNYTTGKLSPSRSQWISNDNTDGAEVPRKRLELYKPDIPTRSHAPLPVDSAHDQFVEFVNSDFEADAAQSTVPFIDIQPVQPMKGGALASGAALIHRGARGSGGVLALKLLSYDYGPHVRADPPAPAPLPDDNDVDFEPLIN